MSPVAAASTSTWVGPTAERRARRARRRRSPLPPRSAWCPTRRGVAVILDDDRLAQGRRRPRCRWDSASAQAAMVSPLIRPGTTWSTSSGRRTHRASASTTTLTGSSRPGATSRPISSATTARSLTGFSESPPPPSDAGASNDVHPSSAARRQVSRSNPSGSDARARVRGDRHLVGDEPSRRGPEELDVVVQVEAHAGPSLQIASNHARVARRTARDPPAPSSAPRARTTRGNRRRRTPRRARGGGPRRRRTARGSSGAVER